MFENSRLNIGERNIKSAKETMKKLGILVIAEDTGKNYGRTVIFDTFNGDLLIKTILKGDKII
jgi:chemotaxis protein CheD